MAGWEIVDERCAVIGGAVNIGVIRLDDARVLLVDSGLDRDAGRRAVRMVADAGWGTVAGILTTHAHADHVGGHPEVVRRTACPVWAPPDEAAIMAAPELAPAIMYGAAPPQAFQTKFLQPVNCRVDNLVTGERVQVDDLGIGVVLLPGHAPGQVGYLVGDTLFAADVVFPAETLAKHVIPFIHSVSDHRRSLAIALGLDCRQVVCGHGPVLDRDAFRALIAANRAVLDRIEAEVISAIGPGRQAGDILSDVLVALDGAGGAVGAVALMGVTVRAVLADLTDRGIVTMVIDSGRITWVRT